MWLPDSNERPLQTAHVCRLCHAALAATVTSQPSPSCPATPCFSSATSSHSCSSVLDLAGAPRVAPQGAPHGAPSQSASQSPAPPLRHGSRHVARSPSRSESFSETTSEGSTAPPPPPPPPPLEEFSNAICPKPAGAEHNQCVRWRNIRFCLGAENEAIVNSRGATSTCTDTAPMSSSSVSYGHQSDRSDTSCVHRMSHQRPLHWRLSPQRTKSSSPKCLVTRDLMASGGPGPPPVPQTHGRRTVPVAVAVPVAAAATAAAAAAAQREAVGAADACQLPAFSEDSFLANLHQRYNCDQIYTYVSSVLVSLNPYKKLPFYTSDIIRAYKTCSRFDLPPHVYALAESAYRSLRELNTDQCVVIAGESGSGKTEACKLILQYVAAVSGRTRDTNIIKNQLLQSNPLLEAFGNAKTSRNDNSSRFGKYMEMEFDFKGDPMGGLITSYMLEKTRISSQKAGERNFHIFYQLLTGADIQLLKSLKLQRNVENYEILKIGKPMQYDSLDDKRDFQMTRRAFDILGFSSEEQRSVLRVVAAVLKLGNITFSPVNNIDGSEACLVDNEYELLACSDLLLINFDTLRSALVRRFRRQVSPFATVGSGLNLTTASASPCLIASCHSGLQETCDLLAAESASLQECLCSRQLEERSELVVADLSVTEAVQVRNALCRSLYSRLFTWLILRINETIKPKKQHKLKVLGIVDIYGFEVFHVNSFEQFVINYFNEKLQHVFVELALKGEQEELHRESVEWCDVDYFNNAAICDLIEKNNFGILSILDDECCKAGQASDASFLTRLRHTCGKHPHFESNSDESPSNRNCHSFSVKHFAGRVAYDCAGFVEKNADILSKELSMLMFRCELPLMKALFPEGNVKRSSLRRPLTASAQLKIAISALMKSIAAKQTHYVRCIQPNDSKVPNHFQTDLVRYQVRYLSLVECARIRSVGFAFKQSYEAFLARFKMLSLHTWPSWRGLPAEGTSYLIRDLPMPLSEFVFGRTKLFIRHAETLQELEDYRRERIDELATLIQKVWRGWRQQRHFESMRRAQTVIAANWRTWRTREQVYHTGQHRRAHWAANVVQRCYLCWQRRRFLLRLAHHLPAASPLSRDWPHAPFSCRAASAHLYKLYHKWRCHSYRLRFDQTSRNRMREKVTASIVFKDRKVSYPRSVSHPFLGDYVRLRLNNQWKRMSVTTNDQYVVFADIINKIARTSGKFVPVLFVLSTSSMLVLDQRTMQIKYRIPAQEIFRISLSPFLDDIAVFHVRETSPTQQRSVVQHTSSGCLLTGDAAGKQNKGDFVFQTGHVIEIVTKLFLVIQNATGKPPDVNIDNEFETNFGHNNVLFSFKTSSHPESTPTQIRIVRRPNRMEVIL